jgi:hypothetical protein
MFYLLFFLRFDFFFFSFLCLCFLNLFPFCLIPLPQQSSIDSRLAFLFKLPLFSFCLLLLFLLGFLFFLLFDLFFKLLVALLADLLSLPLDKPFLPLAGFFVFLSFIFDFFFVRVRFCPIWQVRVTSINNCLEKLL